MNKRMASLIQCNQRFSFSECISTVAIVTRSASAPIKAFARLPYNSKIHKYKEEIIVDRVLDKYTRLQNAA